jgi:hypothetical protein
VGLLVEFEHVGLLVEFKHVSPSRSIPFEASLSAILPFMVSASLDTVCNGSPVGWDLRFDRVSGRRSGWVEEWIRLFVRTAIRPLSTILIFDSCTVTGLDDGFDDGAAARKRSGNEPRFRPSNRESITPTTFPLCDAMPSDYA